MSASLSAPQPQLKNWPVECEGSGSLLPGAGPLSNISAGPRVPAAVVSEGSTTYFVTSNHTIELLAAEGAEPQVLAGVVGRAGDSEGVGANASFSSPEGLALATVGGQRVLVVADTGNHRIKLVSVSTGNTSVLAGSGQPGNVDSIGESAAFNNPSGVAVSPDGQLVFVADRGNHRIRQISIVSRQVSLLSGGGSGMFGGYLEGNAATSAFSSPSAVAIAGEVLVVADTLNHRLRLVSTSDGATSLLAGSGSAGYADGYSLSTQFNHPQGVEFTSDALSVLVSDTQNDRIRVISMINGETSTLVGLSAPKDVSIWNSEVTAVAEKETGIRRFTLLDRTGGCGCAPGNTGANFMEGDCQPCEAGTYKSTVGSTACVACSQGLWSEAGSSSALNCTSCSPGYEGGSGGCSACKIDFFKPTGGNGACFECPAGFYTPDEGSRECEKVFWSCPGNRDMRGPITPGNVTQVLDFGSPAAIQASPDGHVTFFLSEETHQLLWLVNGSTPVVLAGRGEKGAADGIGTNASFNIPYGLDVVEERGNISIFVADFGNNAIRRVEFPSGETRTVAGTLGADDDHVDGKASMARFYRPNDVVADSNVSTLYVSDSGGNRIRKVSLVTGDVSTLSGSGGAGDYAEGDATSSKFSQPAGIAITRGGDYLVVADSSNHRIRMVSTSDGSTKLLSGSGEPSGAFAEDWNGDSTAAKFRRPLDVAITPSGLYVLVADRLNKRIRSVRMSDGLTTTFAGSSITSSNHHEENVYALDARFVFPQGVTVLPDSSAVLVADWTGGNIRRVALNDPSANCTCDVGFTGEIFAEGCAFCAAGKYKTVPGPQACTECPVNATISDPGSHLQSNCTCDVGMTPATDNSSFGCVACAAGYYKNSTGPGLCSRCQDYSTSEPGSNRSDFCLCNQGYTGPNGEVCVACQAGTFKDVLGPSSCTSCPSHLFSDPASTAQENCTCNMGYTGPDGGPCTECDIGTYKNWTGAGNCTMCPTGTYSPRGAYDLLHCICLPGHTGTDGSICTACPTATYKGANGSAACTACPSQSTSQIGSTLLTECMCPQGFYGANGSPCRECETGTFKNSTGPNNCTSCGYGAWSPTGSQDQDNCTCDLGFTGPSEDCRICPSGTYKDMYGETSCQPCQPNSTSVPGSTNLTDCKCVAGFSGADGGECTQCLAGQFKLDIGSGPCQLCNPGSYKEVPGPGSCTPCPLFATSDPGSTAVTNCSCAPGHFLVANTSNVSEANVNPLQGFCAPCSPGTYKDTAGPQNCTVCPAFTYSPTASGTRQNCTCNFGYSGLDGGPCSLCGLGKYKVANGSSPCLDCAHGTYKDYIGPGVCTPCKETFWTEMGSISSDNCTCAPGYYFIKNISYINISTNISETVYQVVINGSLVNLTNGTLQWREVMNEQLKYDDSFCFPCQSGKYKDASGPGICSLCPNASSSERASDSLQDCICLPGYSGMNGAACSECRAGEYKLVNGSSACLPCAENTYKSSTGPGSCDPCPATFVSAAGSITQANCTCDIGYYLPEGSNTCQRCPENTYKDIVGSEACFPCSNGAASPLGSTDVLNCTCSPGFVGADGGTCTACPEGKYKEGLGNATCLSCFPTAVSPIASGSVGACTCDSGYTLFNSSCVACAPGTYKDHTGLGNCSLCPDQNSSSLPGSTSVLDCTCNPGHQISPAGSDFGSSASCELCPLGTYKNDSGNFACLSCPSGSISPAGSFHIHECTCRPGFVGRDGDPCNACPQGKFKEGFGNGTCMSCPVSSSSPEASSGRDNCTCNAGYTVVAGYMALKNSNHSNSTANLSRSWVQWTCTPCVEGTYKDAPGSASCTPCPDTNSTSPSASSLVVNCSCNAGYTISPPGSVFSANAMCVACNSGSFKDSVSNQPCEMCPNGSASVIPATTSITDCICQPGYTGQNFSVCTLCKAGSYKMEFGPAACDDCPQDISFSPVGSTSPDHCTCNTGYSSTGNQSIACKPCPPGSFKDFVGVGSCNVCSNGSYADAFGAAVCTLCTDVDPNSFSEANATSCFCNAGYEGDGSTCNACGFDEYKDAGVGPCEKCDPGTYKGVFGPGECLDLVCSPLAAILALNFSRTEAVRTGMNFDRYAYFFDVCLSCGGTSDGSDGSTVFPQNCTCASGHTYKKFGNSTPFSGINVAGFGLWGYGECVACDPGQYKNTTGSQPCVACPYGSSSPERSAMVINCSCTAGYTGADGEPCDPCTAGTYKGDRGSQSCIFCPSNATYSDPASTSVLNCTCGLGQFPAPGGACQPCREGTYKDIPGLSNCTSCASDVLSSLAGSQSQNDCTCAPGYHNTSGQGCIPCAAGTFKPEIGLFECQPCADPNSDSVGGAAHCSCNGGYFATTDGSCQKCEAGTYKPFGDGPCLTCPSGTYSNMPGLSECISIFWSCETGADNSLAYGLTASNVSSLSSILSSSPFGLTVSPDERFVLYTVTNSIRKIDLQTLQDDLLAGGDDNGDAEGIGTAAAFYTPSSLAVHSDGAQQLVIVADRRNHRIKTVNLDTGETLVLAGSGSQGFADGASNSAQFWNPSGVAVTSDGLHVVVADRNNHRIRLIEFATGSTSTLSGSGNPGYADGLSHFSEFNEPHGLAVTPRNDAVIVADSNNHALRMISLTDGNTTTLAGGRLGAEDGQGTYASFNFPADVDITPSGLYAVVSDTTNRKIRTIQILDGVTRTLAGTGSFGLVDGPAPSATFRSPWGVKVSYSSDFVAVADSGNNIIRSISVEDASLNCSCGPGFTGGPLLRGCNACPSGTYKSVPGSGVCIACPANQSYSLDASTDILDCTCQIGWEPSGAVGCVLCPRGKFKSTTGNSSCSECPDVNSDSLEGSTGIDSCSCNRGYTGSAAEGCQICAADTYKDVVGATACLACPANTSSAPGSQELSNCTCIRGATGPPGGPCESCAEGKYKDYDGNGPCLSCPVGSRSPAGSTNNTDCTCLAGYSGLGGFQCQPCSPGYFKDLEGSSRCVPCPAGTFSNESAMQACLQCPPDSSSVSASISILDCTCNIGFSGPNGGPCTPCEPDTYKSLSGSAACTACPAFATAPRGSTLQTDCLCNAGYEGLAGGNCEPCPLNFFKDSVGETLCSSCGSNAFSPEASISVSNCTCNAGYTGFDANCAACEAGEYKTLPGPSACSSCSELDPNTGSLPGSDSASDCLCKEGFTRQGVTCVQCEAGKYKHTLDNGACTVCPANSHSPVGSVEIFACICNAGYTGSDPQNCQPCSEGTFKHQAGSTSCQACPAFSTSAIASTDLVNCTCTEGYSGLNGEDCDPCGRGTYKNVQGSTACLLCPLHTSSMPASVQIAACICNAGFFGPDGEECTPCATGTYKSINGSSDCTQCPDATNSPQGSSSQDQCICNSGYTGPHGGVCTACREGRYKPANGSSLCSLCHPGTYSTGIAETNRSACTSCPENTDSDSGTGTLANCTCDPGFTGTGGFSCEPCVVGKYKAVAGSEECQACPSGSISPPASIALTACVCRIGYEYSAEGCVPCPLGTFKESEGPELCTSCSPGTFKNTTGPGICLACPSSSRSLLFGATAAEECDCNMGFSGQGGHSCQACEAGSYKSTSGSSECNNCPPGSTSDIGSISVAHCVCEAGFTGPGGSENCTSCLEGKYKNSTGSAECRSCPYASSSPAGSTLKLACVCNAGYSGNDGSTCQACPERTYKEVTGSSSCMPCTSFSYSPSASISEFDCACVPGYIGSNGGPCQQCPSGTYKDSTGSSPCQLCANFTVSPQGSNSVLNCTCQAGYTALGADQSICVPCAAGKFKDTTGSGPCIDCANVDPNSDSLEGSSSALDCVCQSGYTVDSNDTCVMCNAGKYKEELGDSACTFCRLDSTSAPGSTVPGSCVCNAGYYGDSSSFPDACEPCAVGTFKDAVGNQACQLCPTDAAYSPLGSSTLADCTCDVGYGNQTSSGCSLCPVGTFKDFVGPESCIPCRATFTSEAGSVDCECGAGFTLNSSNLCEACPGGKFKSEAGSGACSDCVDPNSHSLVGALQCSCNAGYSNNGDPAQNCEVCQIGFAKPFGDGPCIACPSGKYTDTVGNAECGTQYWVCDSGTLSLQEGIQGVSVAADDVFVEPVGITLESGSGTVYFTTTEDTVKSFSAGTVSDVAGLAGSKDNLGQIDGVGSNARFSTPWGIAYLHAGGSHYLVVGDQRHNNIRVIDLASMTVSTLAGDSFLYSSGYVDGSAGSVARFNRPSGIAVYEDSSSAWQVVVADRNNHVIRLVSFLSGATSTLSGSGFDGYLNGGPLSTQFNLPVGVTVVPAESPLADFDGGPFRNHVLVADGGNHRIRAVSLNEEGKGNSSLVAGSGITSFGAGEYQEGTGSGASFSDPMEVAVTSDGLYALVADRQNQRIRAISLLDKSTKTLAGTGELGSNVGSPSGTEALFSNPSGLAIAGEGASFIVYVADSSNQQIRQIDTVVNADSTCRCGLGYTGVALEDGCVPCAVGTYKDVLGSTECTLCESFQSYSPEASTDQINCTCPLGQYDTAPPSRSCELCASGTYKDFTGPATCLACPDDHAVSADGSTSVTDCLCDKGFTGPNGGVSCVACEPGKYKDVAGPITCFACPADSFSARGGSSNMSCICNAGYSGPDAGPCEACEMGFFKLVNGSDPCGPCSPGFYKDFRGPGACVDCPFGATSDPASNDLFDCTCDGGYTGVNGEDCDACHRGTYKNETGPALCTNCPGGDTNDSPEASNSEDDCKCGPGYTGFDILQCQQCEAGKFKPILGPQECTACAENTFKENTGPGLCVACPANSSSPEGSELQTQCLCDPGFTGPDGGPCTPCLSGTYKPANGSGECSLCPDHAVSALASDSLLDCLCGPGFTGNDGDQCSGCVPGKYKEVAGSVECSQCPNNTNSKPASPLLQNCTCNKGYTGPDGTVCLPCLSGTYKDFQGSGDCLHCQGDENLASPVASTHPMNCTCGAGYYGDVTGCVPCAEGTFKFELGRQACTDCVGGTYKDFQGPGACLECTLHSHSEEGSATAAGCICNVGYTGNDGGPCLACEGGKYKPFNGSAPCLSCPNVGNDSPEGSTEVDDCICGPGYSGPDRLSCTACPAGQFKLSMGSEACEECDPDTFKESAGPGNCTTCPPDSFAAPGSDQATDCKCNAGFEGLDGGPCTSCALGTFKLSSGSGFCEFCEAGKYKNFTGPGSCLQCGGMFISSDEGSEDFTDCQCAQGYQSSDPNYDGSGLPTCEPCGLGHFKLVVGNEACSPCAKGFFKNSTGPGACLPCPFGSTSIPGSTDLQECACEKGYSGPNGAPCQPCSTGSYKDVNGTDPCQTCPGGVTNDSPEASTSVNDCQCGPGYTGSDILACDTCLPGTFKDILGPQACTPCPVDTYESNPASILCSLCPSNSSSPTGSSNQESCVCNPGLTGPDGGPCIACESGKYKPVNGSASCSLCPLHAVTIPGSTALTHCRCGPGFTGMDGGNCTGCLAGQYKDHPGSMPCTQCPPRTNSDPEASGITSCLCNPGFVGPDAGPCEPCEVGTYKNFSGSNNCTECPAHTTSRTGSRNITSCMCLAGYTGPDGLACSPCAPGSFKVVQGSTACTLCLSGTYKDVFGPGICTQCPDINAGSQAGSTQVSDCVCNAGYELSFQNFTDWLLTQNQPLCIACSPGTFKLQEGPESCAPCLPGTFKRHPGPGACSTCPTGSTSNNGSHSILNCTCQFGFTGPNGLNCSSCEGGTYKDFLGPAPCITCLPENTTDSLPGSTSPLDCQCAAGYFGQNTTACTPCQTGTFKSEIGPQNCSLCESGSYKDFYGPGDCTACPSEFSVSEPGSTHILNCSCDAGYEGEIGGACNACPLGKFKLLPGPEQCSPCLAGTYKNYTGPGVCLSCPDYRDASPEGSSSFANCTCNLGLQDSGGICVPCPAGYYKDMTGFTGCRECPANSYSGAASQNITDCECRPGFEAVRNGIPCTACPVGKYKDRYGAGQCDFCPASDSYSKAGSSNLTDCTCNIGFESLTGFNCTACEVGKYKNYTGAGMCFDCPQNTVSNASSIELQDCICQPGYSGPDGGPCLACDVGKFKLIPGSSSCQNCELGSYKDFLGPGPCIQCAPTLSAEPGSDEATDCKCAPGFENVTGNCTECALGFFKLFIGPDACEPCAFDFYKDVQGAGACISCPFESTSLNASTALTDCKCNKGYTGGDGTNCSACAEGEYKDVIGDSLCSACPILTDSRVASISLSQCHCIAGYQGNETVCFPCPLGTFKTNTGTNDCGLCERGKYKDTLGPGNCTDCAPTLNSEPGSTSEDDCICGGGYAGILVLGQLECFACDIGKYKDFIGEGLCEPCPFGTYAPDRAQALCTSCGVGGTTLSLGNTNKSACTCNFGFTGEDGGTCTPCPNGFFKNFTGQGICYACPGISDSPLGSQSLTNCSCAAGYTGQSISACQACEVGKFKLTRGSAPCSDCVPGTYKVDTGPGSCTPCGANENTELGGSSNPQDCFCDRGYFAGFDGVCEPCRPGFFKQVVSDQACTSCAGGTYAPDLATTACTLCPFLQDSEPASIDIANCSCAAGATANPLGGCMACEIGKYKDFRGPDNCTDCPENTNADAGSPSRESCLCEKGYSGPDGGPCPVCASGTFKAFLGSFPCEPCGTFQISPPGSFSIEQCHCDLGYVAKDKIFFDDPLECEICPENTYKDTIDEDDRQFAYDNQCTDCPSFSTSPAGSTMFSNCSCDPGYELSGSQCNICPTGKFKTMAGNEACQLCSFGSFKNTTGTGECIACPAEFDASPEGSDDLSDCTCSVGSELRDGSCAQCPAGKYKDHLGTDSCINCPANTVGPVGSGDIQQCICLAGHQGNSNGLACQPCAEGSFKENVGIGNCTQCPDHATYSLPGSNNISDCACDKGFESQTGQNCTACSPGKYKDFPGRGLCVPCRDNSFSGNGSTRLSDCICNHGYQLEAEICQACPLGKFKLDPGVQPCFECVAGKYKDFEGPGECVQCPHGSELSGNGSTTLRDCGCGYGFTGQVGQDCIPCPGGTYKDYLGDGSCSPCPNLTFSFNGTKSVAGCYCIAGYEVGFDGCVLCPIGKFKDPFGPANCSQCPSGTYKNFSGPGLCDRCPDQAAYSNPGSTSASNCTCGLGFFLNLSESAACQPCRPGNYKDFPGPSECVPCNDNQISPNGSTSLLNCSCVEGFTGPNGGVCEACVPGKFKDFVGPEACLDCDVDILPAFAQWSNSPSAPRSPCGWLCDAGYWHPDPYRLNEFNLGPNECKPCSATPSANPCGPGEFYSEAKCTTYSNAGCDACNSMTGTGTATYTFPNLYWKSSSCPYTCNPGSYDSADNFVTPTCTLCPTGPCSNPDQFREPCGVGGAYGETLTGQCVSPS